VASTCPCAAHRRAVRLSREQVAKLAAGIVTTELPYRAYHP